MDNRKSNDNAQRESETGMPEHIVQDQERTAEGALEAVLFAMGEPVSLDMLAQSVSLTEKETESVLRRMQNEYEKSGRGIRLLKLEDSWQLCTKRQYFENLIAVASHPKKPKLTDPALEALSIIAYRQPVTRAEISRIRGVNSDHAVNRLLEYGLIEETGRLDAPGRPILFGTTDRFLRYFGLSGKEDLPQLSAMQLEDFRLEAEAEIPPDEETGEEEPRKS